MKLTELLRYDLPPELIRLWQEQEGPTLLPLQEQAIKRHKLLEGGNFMIQAPTSSGKTFVGEIAALQTALRRKKVIYLVPLKALAEEKYDDFRRKYADYGIEVIVSTRDRREFDGKLESGDFSIAVMVYEKLAQLLVRRPERLEEVELVVADELEILSDPERGALVELLLTWVLKGGHRLIGLSAVIGHADKLARWMNATLISYDRRPVELRYGVLHEGVFRHRTYNEFVEAEENLVHVPGDSTWEILTENLRTFAEAGEPCIVFVKARHETRRGAELLAGRVNLPPATQAIDALKHLEQTHSRDGLMMTLNSGIAFHNADLTPAERRIVEESFRAGETLVLVSTSTLAMGMNLPAQNVFISTDKWQYDSRFGMPWKTPILRAEYENMGGRAGRYGVGRPYGRSILIAATSFDEETLWRRYVEGEREQVEPRLAQEPLDNHVLRLVAARRCVSDGELQEFFAATLTGTWIWTETLSPEEMEFRVRAALNRVIDYGAVARTSTGRIEATPFGHAIAAKGITLNTARELAEWLSESETRDWLDLDLMLAAALTPDGRMVQVTLTTREYEQAEYPQRLKAAARDEELGPNVPLNRLRNCNLMPFFEEVRAIKTSLFLNEWIGEANPYDIEEDYYVFMGQIMAAAEQVSWLVDATAALAAASGAPETLVTRITELAERIQWGVSDEVLPIARLRLEGLTRSGLLALAARNLHQPDLIVQTSVDTLVQWLPRAAAHTLKTWANGKQTVVTPVEQEAPHKARPVLVVDDRRPGAIQVDGRNVRLQEKQYRLIQLLAAAPGECVSYDTIYETLWGDAIVEQNQIHFQKRKLLEQVRTAVPARKDIVKTIPKRGFLLNLTPDEVVLRVLAKSSAA
ncbi:MAG: DEAD/DEAH box helicase [Candidatus Hydrogenedentes bacterium]|nr:DEAD/DEAH box helicase [Candidatus Hydrogenedentota bacterium]